MLGTMAVVIRALGLPDGSERSVAYLGDLKVAVPARRGRALLALGRAAEAWTLERADAAFGVVMDGTRINPGSYGGHAGIPKFRELGRVGVLRFSTEWMNGAWALDRGVDEAEVGEACYRELSGGRYWSPGGAPGERSCMHPRWLVRRDGSACGCLEDTRRAKRLLVDDGSELVSAHLSGFAYRTPAAGATMIAAALRRSAELGYPGLFVSVPEANVDALARELPGVSVLTAPAVIHGIGLEAGSAWNINPTEI